eukprot:2634601-Amphidinium_carterae.1
MPARMLSSKVSTGWTIIEHVPGGVANNLTAGRACCSSCKSFGSSSRRAATLLCLQLLLLG